MPWRILPWAFKINWGECRPGPWAQPVEDAQVLLTKRSQGLDNETQCAREWHGRGGPSCTPRVVLLNSLPQFSGHSLCFAYLILLPSFDSPRLTHLMFFRILPLKVFWPRLIPESQETKANSPRGAKAVTEDKAILQLLDLLAIDIVILSYLIFISFELSHQNAFTDFLQLFPVDVQCYHGNRVIGMTTCSRHDRNQSHRHRASFPRWRRCNMDSW